MIVEFRIIKKNEPLMIWAHSLNSIYNKKYTLFSPAGSPSISVLPLTPLCVLVHPYHHLPICIYSKSQNGAIIVTISSYYIS